MPIRPTKMSKASQRNRDATSRHIHVVPFQNGWTVGEAAFDNAQFFHNRAHAEEAARQLGQRLNDAGDPTEIRIRTADGGLGCHFIISKDDSRES